MYQTAREKVDPPKEHFWAPVPRLLGAKYHIEVYEAVAKVEKAMCTGAHGPVRRGIVIFHTRGVA